MGASSGVFGLTPQQLNYAESAQWKQLVRQALADSRFASPGFLVEDMNAEAQTVTVQIAIQERVRTKKGAQWWDVPPIVNVPIVTARGGGYAVTLPLKKGDQGLLVFCDACFDTWWVNGQENAPPAANVKSASGSQTQLEVRRHHVHDCGFIPGMWSQNNTLTDYSSDSLQIRSEDGSTLVDVSTSGVIINGTTVKASSGGATQPLVTKEWQDWFTAFVLPHITTGIIPPQPAPTTVFEAE